MFKYSSIFVLFWAFALNALAQSGTSPYTTIGIGDVRGMSLIHNDAMGGVGIATAKPWNMSTINPAWLPINELTTFEIGLDAQQRTIQQDTLSRTYGGGNLSYLAISFPIKPARMTMSVGLMPYSNVDYEISSSAPIQNSNEIANTTFRGSGGMNQAFIATGIRFFKHLYAGARLGYLFSSINEDVIVNPFGFQVNDTTSGSFFKSVYSSKTTFSDFYLSTGLGYEFKIGKKSFINLGATYDLQAAVSAERTTSLERRQDNPNTQIEETIDYGTPSTTDGSIFLPAKYGIGIAFQRGTKWNIAADAVFQDWSQFRNFSGGASENLGQMSRFAIGVEFIPDFFSVRRYWDRVSYKAGISFGDTPFIKNNQQIKEFGINFGGSFPIKSPRSLVASYLTLNLGYGQRGTTSDNLVYEDFYTISLGFSINDLWFQQRKYD